MDQSFFNRPESPQRLEEQFGIIANSSPVMIWISDTDGVCYYFNDGWLKFTGKTIEQECGNGWLQDIHPDDRSECQAIFVRAFDLKTEFKREYRLKRWDGTYRSILDHGVPRYTSEGNFAGYLGSCIEMEDGNFRTTGVEKGSQETELLNEAIKELKRSNEALEEFAYVASHDMKEPLRKILVYNEFVLTHTHDTEKYSSKIKESALRMDKLIDDLLDFSKIRLRDDRFEWIDMNSIVVDVKKDLELVIEEKKAVFKSMSLPVIYGMKEQIRQMMYNVLFNSLKYSKSDEPPVITIEYFETNSEKFHRDGLVPGLRYNEFVITDNGIGFDQQEAEKIFSLFQRLHNPNDVPGTGLGLALSKKVVENHKGIIFAESKINEGATFHILLPEDPKTLHLNRES